MRVELKFSLERKSSVRSFQSCYYTVGPVDFGVRCWMADE